MNNHNINSNKAYSQPSTQHNRIFPRASATRERIDPWKNKETSPDNRLRKDARNNIYNNEMNDTFTSQKAKRNVSEYYNTSNRPIHSREKEETNNSRTSPGFSTLGLENIGNT